MRELTGDSHANDPAPNMLTPAAKAWHPTAQSQIDEVIGELRAIDPDFSIFRCYDFLFP